MNIFKRVTGPCAGEPGYGVYYWTVVDVCANHSHVHVNSQLISVIIHISTQLICVLWLKLIKYRHTCFESITDNIFDFAPYF